MTLNAQPMLRREEEFLESDEWADCVHDLRKEQRSHLVAAAAMSSERDGLAWTACVPHLGRQLANAGETIQLDALSCNSLPATNLGR